MKSTWWWLMFLDRNNPVNKVDVMYGYSMYQGRDEKKDKERLLMDIIIRLFVNGWFSKADKIVVYKRTGEFIEKDKDKTAAILTATGYTLTPEFEKPFKDFLTKFYKLVRDGQNVRFLLPATRASLGRDEYLNIDVQHLKIKGDISRLYDYCSRLVRNGHRFADALSFYHRYITKYG